VRWGVVTFPGSNDDRDTLRAIDRMLGDEAVSLWHKDEDLQGVEAQPEGHGGKSINKIERLGRNIPLETPRMQPHTGFRKSNAMKNHTDRRSE